jgi:hypothetical protein
VLRVGDQHFDPRTDLRGGGEGSDQ